MRSCESLVAMTGDRLRQIFAEGGLTHSGAGESSETSQKAFCICFFIFRYIESLTISKN